MIELKDGRGGDDGRAVTIYRNRESRFRIFNTVNDRAGVGVNLNREDALVLAEELLKYLEETE